MIGIEDKTVLRFASCGFYGERKRRNSIVIGDSICNGVAGVSVSDTLEQDQSHCHLDFVVPHTIKA